MSRRIARRSFLAGSARTLGVWTTAGLAGIYPWTAAADESPSTVIERFHEQLLAVMKEASELGIRGRYARLAPPVESAFNLPFMIQTAVGTEWQKATPEQRQSLIDAFTHLSVSTYAFRFNGYSGQSFKSLGERPAPSDRVLVDTQIIRPGEAAVGLIYVTRKSQAGPRILDVLVDNAISELARMRSEYRNILQDEGFDALVATLRRKADDLIAAR